MRNGDNDPMGSTGPASPAVNRMPGSRPGHPVTGRALRELAFCAIEGPLGLAVLGAVIALPALGLLAALLAGGGAQTAAAHPGTHPRGPFSAFGVVFLLVLPCLLVLVPWAARRLAAVHRGLVARLLGERIAGPPPLRHGRGPARWLAPRCGTAPAGGPRRTCW